MRGFFTRRSRFSRLCEMKDCIQVDESMVGLRLDQAVAAGTEMSRSQVKRLIEGGRVTLNGVVVKARASLSVGDSIAWECEALIEEAPRPEALALDVLFEDEAILVLNKPAGLLVHPGAGHRDGTLLNGLLGYDAVFSSVDRAGIVHRLDKDTSGVLAVAKTEAAQLHLQAQFKCRTTEKRYTALVQGIPPAAMRLEHNLGRHPMHRKKQAVVKREGRLAISQVYREAVFGAVAQVGVEIETGRTHQIRVQMAHMGHPVLGDTLYSPRKQFSAVEVGRQMLHASRLCLRHPESEKHFCFEAPLPDDMVRCIEKLRECM